MNLSDMDPEALSGNKIVRTFRMPVDLVHTLGREATQRGLDLTALVLRILHGYLTYFALPEAAIAQLEADREALKMDRNQYLSHLLYHRCMAIREHGVGFDDPYGPASKSPPPRESGESQAPPQAPPEDPNRKALGAAGGGAHGAVEGLVPGAGVWPYGIKRNRPQGR